jgi:fatty acid synthase subunit beta
VTHATKVNEPAREILDNMNDGIIDYVLGKQGVARDSAEIPTTDVLWSALDSAGYEPSAASSVTVEYDAAAIAAAAAAAAAAEESGAKASHQQWYERVVKSAATIGCASWLRAALLAEDVVDRKKWVANPLRRLLAPARGQTLVLSATQGQVTSLKVYSSATKLALDEASVTFDAQPLSAESASIPVVVTIIDRPPAEDGVEQDAVTLSLRMRFNPLTPAMPLQWSQKEMSDDLREFYRALWSLDPSAFDDTADESVRRGTCALSKAKVAALNGAVGQPTSAYAAVAVNAEAEAIKSQWVTTDAAITIAWKPMMECLLMQGVGGNLLDLVHLSNSYEWLFSESADRFPIGFEEEIAIAAEIVELTTSATGKTIAIKSTLARDGVAFFVVLGRFFIRGDLGTEVGQRKFKKDDVALTVNLPNVIEAEVLRAKPWLSLVEGGAEKLGADATVRFSLACTEWPAEDGTLTIEVRGDVDVLERNAEGYITPTKVGSVAFSQDAMVSNPVVAYVERLRVASFAALDTQGKNSHRLFETEDETATTLFGDDGYNMLAAPYESTAPTDTVVYSTASSDLNPIHRSRYMAELAGLPRCIVHGMWTFATSRRVVEVNLCGGDQRNLRHFSASFQAMVMPGERLWTQLRHIGFRRGRKVVEVTTSNAKGITVLTGRAEVEPGTTAYVFTGQGSAAKGMGMDLYESSPAAKELWDNADAHLQKTYGWSILDIVRRNPSSLTIYFGGKRGQAVRENFLALVCKDPETGEIVPLIPEITEASDSYSFHSPDGLLFATQFTQPALVLLEQSYFVDMVSRDMMSSHYMFAGHSLGEYAALAAAADVIPPLALLDLVFLRGLTMQRAVSRDAKGRSDFGMVAASPNRVGVSVLYLPLHFTRIMLTI